jgi:hypothetical protein
MRALGPHIAKPLYLDPVPNFTIIHLLCDSMLNLHYYAIEYTGSAFWGVDLDKKMYYNRVVSNNSTVAMTLHSRQSLPASVPTKNVVPTKNIAIMERML